MNEFKSLESLVRGGSYLVGLPRRLYVTTSWTLGEQVVQAMVFKYNFVEQARVSHSGYKVQVQLISCYIPHLLAFLNMALIRSTSLFRMNP